jgi:hypothetical protein
VAEHKRKLGFGKIAIDHVEIGTAHATGVYAEEDLVGTWLWPGYLGLT